MPGPPHRIEFGPHECSGVPATRKHDSCQNSLQKMCGQRRGQERSWHVFDERPHEIAMAEGGRQATVTPGTRPTHVVDDGIGHVPRVVAGESEPKAEVDVLAIAEKVFVEPTHGGDGIPSIEHRGGTGRENFAVAEVVGADGAAVPLPPGHAP